MRVTARDPLGRTVDTVTEEAVVAAIAIEVAVVQVIAGIARKSWGCKPFLLFLCYQSHCNRLPLGGAVLSDLSRGRTGG